jgi:hypothetical protein
MDQSEATRLRRLRQAPRCGRARRVAAAGALAPVRPRGPSVQVREEEEDGQRVKIDASGRGTGDGELRGDNPDLRSAAEADDVSYFSDQNGLALIPT